MEMNENSRFCEPEHVKFIPGTHRITGCFIKDGVHRYKVYDPGRCEIVLDMYLTDSKTNYGDCLTKLRFLDVIKGNGLTNIKRVVNIVYIETNEEYRGQGIATRLLLDFLKGYKTSKTDIVVVHCNPIDVESISDFCIEFDNFFEPFGFKCVPDLSNEGTITFSNSYLFLSAESEASRSLNKIFNRKTWGIKDE